MPVSHSSFVDWSGPVSCGCALLPLKTKVKGPAAPCPNDSIDIIDEAIMFFRANVLFRNFQPSSPADLTLCYLTIYIGELLRAFTKCRTKDDAKKTITSLSMSTSFAVPGDKTFVLPGFFTTPATRQEGEAFKSYFRQAREETAIRMVELAYSPQPIITQSTEQTTPQTSSSSSSSSTTPGGGPDATHNKWWMAFAKRKFMNIAST